MKDKTVTKKQSYTQNEKTTKNTRKIENQKHNASLENSSIKKVGINPTNNRR